MLILVSIEHDLPYVSYDYQKGMFVDSLTEHMHPPNYVHSSMWSR